MAISVKHAFQSAKADGPDSTLVQPSSWNAEHTITAAAGVVLGRNTSGAGAIQELPLAIDTTGNLSLPTGAGYAINGTSVLTATALGSAVVTSSLTSVGTITTGTWNATTIAVNRGGTGATSLTSGYLLKGNGTSAVSASAVYESGGNVGIGTSSPNAKLEVSGDIAVTGGGNIRSSSTSSVWSISGGNTYNNGGSIIVAGSTSGIIPGGIAFNTGTGATNTERMRIDNNGNVGIGTSSPTQKLTVQGNILAIPTAGWSTGNTAFVYLGDTNNGIKALNGGNLDVYSYGGIGLVVNGPAPVTALTANTAGNLVSAPTYNTTAAGSNVVVTSAGLICRTSSSIKYKKDVESLDPALATNAIDRLRPVWYRTKNPEGDDKATWSHIGLIAEEVHEVEPRLVRYRTAEVIEEQKPVLDENGDPALDDDGNPTTTIERTTIELEVPEPEDVDYARLSVLLLAEIQSLRARVAALEAA